MRAKNIYSAEQIWVYFELRITSKVGMTELATKTLFTAKEVIIKLERSKSLFEPNLLTLSVQFFANRNFREVGKSRNLGHFFREFNEKIHFASTCFS